MLETFSALAHRFMNALLAYHIDAVRARRAATLAQRPRHAQARLRAMYIPARRHASSAESRVVAERPLLTARPRAHLGAAGIAALGVFALIVIVLVLSSPQSV